MKYIFYFICFLLLSNGCSTDPEFDRNNPNDPLSENFSPVPPENSSVSVDITDRKDIVFSWNKKPLQDGVFISKKYSALDEFTILDTLIGLKNAPAVFLDKSRDFTVGTTYKFQFFRVLSDSTRIVNPDPYRVEFEFEPVVLQINNGTIPASSLIYVSWEYRPQTKVKITFFDGIDIAINRSSNIDSDKWETIGSITNKRSDYYTVPLFDIRAKATPFVYDSAGVKVPINVSQHRFYTNLISSPRYSRIDETDSVVIKWSWEHYLNPHGYVISAIKSDTIPQNFERHYGGYRLYLPSDKLPITVSVQPFINENFGNTISVTIPKPDS